MTIIWKLTTVNRAVYREPVLILFNTALHPSGSQKIQNICIICHKPDRLVAKREPARPRINQNEFIRKSQGSFNSKGNFILKPVKAKYVMKQQPQTWEWDLCECEARCVALNRSLIKPPASGRGSLGSGDLENSFAECNDLTSSLTYGGQENVTSETFNQL